jgi:hypothetical protein
VELRDPRPQAVRAWPTAVARLALLAGPTAIAFFSGGYFEDARLVAAIAAWAALALLTLVVPGPLPLGAAVLWALGGLLALTVWTLISNDWAPLAGPAGDAAERCALYLGALAAGVLAWRGGRDWARAVEPALAAGTLIVVGYGLAGRLLPGIVHQQRSITAAGRLEQPLTYWNAMGALAAIGVVLCVRLAGDRTRARGLRAAAAAVTPVLATGLYTTYSRGAAGACAAGLLVLLLLAPTWAQLRAGAISLEVGAIGVLVVSRLHGVSSLEGSLGHRETQGALMLAVLAALGLVGLAVHAYGTRAEDEGRLGLGPLPFARWRRVGLVAATLGVAALPYALAVATERGSAQSTAAIGATAERFKSLGSNRYAYWRVAAHTFADHPLKGAGAGSFRVEWLARRRFDEPVRDAHSLELQTLAELGLVGFAALLALLGGVALAARRAWQSDPALATGPAAAAAVWLVHAGVDWDWEMPAVTLVAVVLAGLLLARAAPPPPPSP